MKPHVICHMVSSVDGRTWQSRQRPERNKAGNLFEVLHDRLGSDAWLVGRVTGREFAKRDFYPTKPASQSYPRTPWFARREAAAWGIVIDAKGKIAWGRSDIGGDPIVVVLTEQAPDSHLEALREEGVSYVFAGETELDLALLLEIPNKELGIERLLVLTTRGRIIRLGAESGELVREVCTAKRAMVSDSPALQLVCAHDGVATSLSASPNAVYLATCASDGLIKVGVHH